MIIKIAPPLIQNRRKEAPLYSTPNEFVELAAAGFGDGHRPRWLQKRIRQVYGREEVLANSNHDDWMEPPDPEVIGFRIPVAEEGAVWESCCLHVLVGWLPGSIWLASV